MGIEVTISDMLTRAGNVDEGVQAVLAYLGEALNVSRVYVFENTEDGLYTNNTYEWCAPGVEPQIGMLQHLSIQEYGYDKIFVGTDVFNCPDVSALPEGTRAILDAQDIKAMVQCAIRERGELRGFIGVDDCVRRRDDWREESAEGSRLRFVARLLSMYLLKERSLQALARAKERELREQTSRGEALAQENLDLVNSIIGSGMWYFSFDEQGNRTQVTWSDNFRHMLGYQNEQDFPNTIDSWVGRLHPEDRDEVLHRYAQGISGEREYDVKCRVKKKDGTYDWFNIHGKCARYPNGQPRLFAGTFINITLAENEASDLNARMAAVLGGVRGGLKICTTAEGFPNTYISEEVAAIQGYTVSELRTLTHGSTVENILPEDREAAVAAVRLQLQKGPEHSVKYRVRHKDGTVRWLHDFGRRVVMPDGTELIYSLIQDITEEQTLNIRLATEQAQYRDALMKNALYSLTFDVTDGHLKQEIVSRDGVSKVASLGLGLPCSYDEYCRKYAQDYGVEVFEDSAKLLFSRDGILKMYQSGLTLENIEYYKKATDTYIRALALLSRDRPTGHIIATIICFDVTAAKKVDLERQRALKDALAQAEHANRAKTTFLNNMSHDIRTPMNAIIGFTALASTHVDDKEKVVDYLKKIQTSSNHLLSLINDVLDMSRIESGKVKIEESEISLPEVMHDIKNIVQADVRAKQLELFFDTVDVMDENVWCDRLRLNQILLNCMSNAIKFTPAGGTIGMKVIQVPCRTEGYAAYEFKVRDTGIGMSQEFIGHIFEPFERERTSTVSGIQGTGLGMSITKNIVDMMGGTISVTSEKGKGSEFTISLQLRLTTATKQSCDIPALKSVHALVADDNFDTCSSVAAMLRKIGLRPEWTMSGKEAVLRARDAKANLDPFGVYIIDWLMPDMNGVEVVRRIRSEIDSDTPIIILTAYDWTDIEDEARAAGVTAFCAKPLFLSELRTLLEKASSELLETAPQPEQEPEPDLTGMRILLVEDNEMNREIAQEILTERGADIDTAENGAAAVEKVRTADPGRYDVVLMDVQMPVMDGYEATSRIRALPGGQARIPIIAMTANAFAEDRAAAMQSGMDGYIAKPIQIGSIARTIRAVLRK